MSKRFQFRVHEEKTKYTSKMSAAKRAKHWPRKGAKRAALFDAMLAKADIEREAELLPVAGQIAALIPADWEGPRPVTMHSLGGFVPMQGDGTTDTGENWYFRFRGDSASLRVYGEELLEPRLAAVCDDLTGEPYNGALSFVECIATIRALWTRMTPTPVEAIPAEELRPLLPASMFEHVVSELQD